MISSFARVGDLAEQIRGVTYGKEDASKEPIPGYLPVLRAGNITDSGLTFDDLVYVPEARVTAKQKIKKGDIVIAASSGSLDVVGKAAAALNAFNGGFGAFCKVIRPNNKVDAGYLAQFFKTPSYRRTISSLAAGANINNLKSEHLDDLRVPLPPLPEQRRIAAILDQADALRAKRREALAQLDSLTQSIFIEMFGDPVSNQKRWPELTFDQTASDETSRAAKTLQADYLEAGSFPIIDQGQKAVAGYTNDETKLCPCELPVVVFGDHTRAIKLVTSPFAVGADGAKVLSPKPAVSAVYLAHLLRLLPIPNLGYSRHMKELKRMLYPIAPLALQQIFATRIQTIESLKATHRAALAESDALFASLQHRAFTGEL